jgi:hypothetical protein
VASVALILLVSSCDRSMLRPSTKPDLSAGPSDHPARSDAVPAEPVTFEQLERDYEATGGDRQRLYVLEPRVRRYLEEHPEDAAAILLLANVELAQGELEEAFAVASRCAAAALDIVAKDRVGSVRSVEIVENTLGAPEIAACTLDLMKPWRFWGTSSGVVSFTLLFSPH